MATKNGKLIALEICDLSNEFEEQLTNAFKKQLGVDKLIARIDHDISVIDQALGKIRIILGKERIDTGLQLFDDVLLKRLVDGRIVCEKAIYIKRTDRTILFLTYSGEELRLYERDGIFDGLNLPGIWGKSGYYLDRCD